MKKSNIEIMMTIKDEYRELRNACISLKNHVNISYFGNKKGHPLSEDEQFSSDLFFYKGYIGETKEFNPGFFIDVRKDNNYKIGCNISFKKASSDIIVPIYEVEATDSERRKYKSFKIGDTISSEYVDNVIKHNIIGLPEIDYKSPNLLIESHFDGYGKNYCSDISEISFNFGLNDDNNSSLKFDKIGDFEFVSDLYGDEKSSYDAIYELLTGKVSLDELPDEWAEILERSDIHISDSSILYYNTKNYTHDMNYYYYEQHMKKPPYSFKYTYSVGNEKINIYKKD